MAAIRFLKKVMRDQTAATVIEYGLIISLVVLAIVGMLNTLASNTIGMWSHVSTTVQDNVN